MGGTRPMFPWLDLHHAFNPIEQKFYKMENATSL